MDSSKVTNSLLRKESIKAWDQQVVSELEKVKEEKVKRSVGHKEYLMGLLKTELEKVTGKSKKGFGYNVVPSPHPLILNRPTPLDLSYSGLEEFKQPEVDKDWKENFFCPANQVGEEEPKKGAFRFASKAVSNAAIDCAVTFIGRNMAMKDKIKANIALMAFDRFLRSAELQTTSRTRGFNDCQASSGVGLESDKTNGAYTTLNLNRQITPMHEEDPTVNWLGSP
ncbi:hypothetical protein Tco_0412810 [Tanacetum coccineum]